MLIKDHEIAFYGCGDPSAPVIYMPLGTGDRPSEAYEISSKSFNLAVISGFDWDRELSPWPAPPAFKKSAPFGGGADKSLDLILDMMPEIENAFGLEPKKRGIAGYSLAGLFALYAMFKTDAFELCGCVSGSLWFPKWDEFIASGVLKPSAPRIYLSLGDAEGKTRNPVMASVDDRYVLTLARLKELGAEAIFESNPGNHFADVPDRIAKAFDRLVQ